jgi:hypothetical protein
MLTPELNAYLSHISDTLLVSRSWLVERTLRRYLADVARYVQSSGIRPPKSSKRPPGPSEAQRTGVVRRMRKYRSRKVAAERLRFELYAPRAPAKKNATKSAT